MIISVIPVIPQHTIVIVVLLYTDSQHHGQHEYGMSEKYVE